MKNLPPILFMKVQSALRRLANTGLLKFIIAILTVFLFYSTFSHRTELVYLDDGCRDTLYFPQLISNKTPSPEPKKQTYQDRVQEFKSKVGYTPYQVLLIYTKAKEGFARSWYKDGIVKGRQSYSIGYGINNQGDKKLHKHIAALYTNNGKTDKNLSTKAIQDYYINHKPRTKGMDIFEETAWLLHCYNRGTPKKLDRCCKSKKPGCGSKDKRTRAAHEERRKFETALVNKDFAFVKAELKKCIEEDL